MLAIANLYGIIYGVYYAIRLFIYKRGAEYMARNDAKDVERQYYEFKRRMEQKRANAPAKPAPVKKAAPASQKSPIKKSAKPIPPKAEEKPAAPEITPVEVFEEAAAQPVSVEVPQPAAYEMPAEPEKQPEMEIPGEAAAADIPEDDFTGEELNISFEPEDESYAAEDEPEADEEYEEDDKEDDSDDEDEDDGEESVGFMNTIRETGSRLLSGLSGFASSLGGKLRSLKRGKADEEYEEDEESFDEASYEEDSYEEETYDEAPAEEMEEPEIILESETAEDTFEAPVQEADAADLTEEAADAPAEDLAADVGEISEAPIPFEEDPAFDENVDPDLDEDNEDDEDDEGEKISFFARLMSGIKARRSRAEDDSEESEEDDDGEDDDEDEEEDKKPGFFARLKQRRPAESEDDEEAEEDAEEASEPPVISEEASYNETEEAFDAEEEAPVDAAPAAIELDDDWDDDDDAEYEDVMAEGAAFENLYEAVPVIAPAEAPADEPVLEEEIPAPHADNQEGEYTPMENNNNNRKSMTELMAEGLNDTPTLSRRERRMLAEADAAKKAPAAKISADLEALEDADMNEEPTQEYTPVRARADEPAARPAALKRPIVALDDDDEDDEEEEEEIRPVRKPASKKKAPLYEDEDDEDDDDDEDEEEVRPARKPFGRKKAPVYDDDEDDEEDDYDEDDEEDDDDYDDDDDEEVSFGKRLFGFLKYLLAIIVIVALVVLGLRVCEGAGYISLDSVRSALGNSSFVTAVFPEPAAEDAGDTQATLSPLTTPSPAPTDAAATDAPAATDGAEATTDPAAIAAANA